MKKVLFVRTANTCRRLMVQAIFDALAEDEGLPFRAESAGTEAPEETAMAENAVAALEEAGIYPGLHSTRWLTRRWSRWPSCARHGSATDHRARPARKGLAAGHPYPGRVHDRCSGGRYTRRPRAHHGRLPKHLALAVRACGTRGGDASGTTRSRERARRRMKDTPNGLAARPYSNCCLAKTAYRRSRRASRSYGMFLEHPISARVGKWLPPKRGATSTRQKIGTATMVISYLDTPHAGLVPTNFPAASPPSGLEK